jgi:predicted nucleic acid-binding protein
MSVRLIRAEHPGSANSSSAALRNSLDAMNRSNSVFPVRPLVVDSDVLIRNLVREVRPGAPPTKLFLHARQQRVRMFIADHQVEEVRRHLTRVALAAGVDPTAASRMFEHAYLPLLQLVTVGSLGADDPLVNAVRRRDSDDVATAQLAVLLGSRVVTDNKAHFRGVAIQHDWLTVVAAYAEATSFDSANASVVVSVRVTGQGMIAAGKGFEQGFEYLVEHPRVALGVGIGILLFAALAFWFLYDDDRRSKIKDAVADITPRISGAVSQGAEWYASRLEAAARAEAVLSAVALPQPPLCLEQELARALAAARWPLPVKDLVIALRNHSQADIVATLKKHGAFVKQPQGWTLGRNGVRLTTSRS